MISKIRLYMHEKMNGQTNQANQVTTERNTNKMTKINKTLTRTYIKSF